MDSHLASVYICYNSKAIHFVLLGLLLLMTKSAHGRGQQDNMRDPISDEERLYNRLFRNYNPMIRPVRRSTDTVNVNLTLAVKQIHTVDEIGQTFTTNGWVIVEWWDRRLTWKQERYHNLSEFVVESTRLWIPELALINGVDEQFPDFSKYKAIVSSKGQVRWEPAGVFKTSCKIDITYYPYDNQICDVVFGTWTYTSFKLNLTNSTPIVILDDYSANGEWDILEASLNRTEFVYECCENIRFSKVSAKFHLKRLHSFYTLNIILPCIMLSMLVLVTFLSPPDQGEKISLGISILLSFSVFMLTLTDNMPKTSESVPLFGIYTTSIMLMNTMSVMLTVFVLNLHHRHDDRPVPKWVKTVIINGMGWVLCVNTTGSCSSTSRDSRRPRVANRALIGGSATVAFDYDTKLTPLRRSATNHIRYSNGNESRERSCTAIPLDSLHAQENHALAPSEENHPTYERNRADWRRLARVVDRFFFWMSLLALITISLSIFTILWI